MSRSNPTAENSPNPSTRWFEWNGAEGHFRYYDKDKEENVDLPPDFSFIVLDQMRTVTGWHEQSKSGIYANEVRDTQSEPLTVKSFKGGLIAAGIYNDIKDRVANAGGSFTVNAYVAYRDGKEWKLGTVQFRGAALGEWFDFVKNNRKAIYSDGIRVKGSTKDKKGKIEFFRPIISVVQVSEATAACALKLDTELQAYLTEYLSRKATGKAEHAAERPQADAPAEVDPEDAPKGKGKAAEADPDWNPEDPDDVPM